ncbi:MAG TPA: cyclodeaminase/cyclohydrolase family protein [Gaiellaceae bacterium]|nr:cyclodeaminase/cyclohydrolase family protein [Gaiellaceae bacterium]
MEGGDRRLEVEGALEALGSPARAPASGSAAALAGALAAAVVVKAARASARDGAAAQALALQQRLARSAVDDADALAEARLLLAGPAGDDFRLGGALVRAMAIPAAIASDCADVAALAAAEREHVLGDYRPDLQAAAALAAGAAQAAAHLVAVNLAARPDDERVASSRGAAAGAADVVAGFGAV